MSDLKKALQNSGLDLLASSRTTKVIVALRVAEPDAACLDHLRGLGLSIERVLRSKVIGTVEARAIPALKADPRVEAVERSVPLERRTRRTR